MKLPSTKRGWLGLGCGSVIVLVVVCAALGAVMGPQTPSSTQPVAVVADPTEASAAPPAAPEAPAVPTDVPPTTAPEPPAAGVVGEPREAGGVQLTVTAVTRAPELGQFQKAEDGNEYVLAEVIIATIGRDAAPYNPFYFKVKDADGYEYTVALNTGDRALKSGELSQGDTVRGIVAFEVPIGATGLILSYEPIVIAGGYDPIRIALD